MPPPTSTAHDLPLASILMGLVGGLSLFLLGMDLLSAALRAAAGRSMRVLLGRLTSNRLAGAAFGALATAAVQSSSVTTVLLVGFISAGLMTVRQSIGVIMGANVGSTVTAQMIAFKVTGYALVAVALGFWLRLLARHDRLRQTGQALLGLGLLFYGMHLMSQAASPLRSYSPFIDLMGHISHPLPAVALAAVFTALIQSSAATTGIIIILASQHLVTMPTAVALVLGANIGTCVTALLATIGAPRAALQAALVHVLFNVVGAMGWLLFIGPLVALVTALSPDNPARQVANAHTLINVINLGLFIGFTGPIARLVEILVPAPPQPAEDAVEPRFINDLYLDDPDTALDSARREIVRAGQLAVRLLQATPATILHGNTDQLQRLARMDDRIDRLYEAIVAHLGKLSRRELTDDQIRRLQALLAAIHHIENVGDSIETNLVSLGEQRIRDQVHISQETAQALGPLIELAVEALESAVQALDRLDADLARQVIASKPRVQAITAGLYDHLRRRLVADAPNRVITFKVESDIIEQLKNVFSYARRFARAVVDLATP